MTLPSERTNSLFLTRMFLIRILDHKERPKTVKEWKTWARSCLKHYPDALHIDVLAKKCPDILGVKEKD